MKKEELQKKIGGETHAFRAIIRPYVSEKAQQGLSYNQYSFLVEPKSTKSDIKREIQHMYKVKVIGITVTTIRSKTKRFRNHISKFINKKKATVTVAKGQSLNLV